MPVRLLGEDLVVYRDQRGRLGLVGDKCPHRLGGMVMWIPEEGGLRCSYHGWLYDASGQCIEQPYEDHFHPELRFKDKIKIKAYQVQELGGLVWAYLGPEPAPLVPRWEVFVKEGVFREVGMTLLPVNWLQARDNSDGGHHVPELHGRFSRYVLKQLGLEGAARDNHSAGGGLRRVASDHFFRDFSRGDSNNDTETGKFRLSRGEVFPCMVVHPDGHAQIKVPVDDTHTLWFYYYTFDVEEVLRETGIRLEPTNESKEVPTFEVPLPRVVHRWAQPDWERLDNNSGQDQAMLCSIGPIADWTMEHLDIADSAVVAYRKLLEQQIKVVEDGGDPINTFRDPEQNRCIVVPMVKRGKQGDRMALRNDVGRIDRTQAARKYSSVFRAMDAKERGEDVLNKPVH